MTHIKLKYVTRDRDARGNVRLYVRLPGKRKVRLRGVPGSKEFMDAYNAALEETKPESTAKTLDWLCDAYYKSTYFKALNELTRRDKFAVLERVCMIEIGGKRIGLAPFASITKAHVRALRDLAASTPGAADKRVKYLSGVFAWAVKAEVLAINPAFGVEKINIGSKGFYTWTERDAEAFEAAYPLGTRERVAFAVMLYLGVRRSDAVRLGPQHESPDGQSIAFQVWKGRERNPKDLTLPILPPLREALEAGPIGAVSYLTTAAGKQHASGDSFGNWFRDACRAAGLPECSPHGVRKIAAVRCAEAGATEYEMMALFGWDTPDMARVYIKMAQQKKMARNAAAKLQKG